MQKTYKILLFFLLAITFEGFSVDDYDSVQKSRNRILSAFSDLTLSETEIEMRILGSIYEPFNLNINEQSKDPIETISKHLKINELRNRIDSLTVNQMEQATITAIDEEFNIATLESFTQTKDIISIEQRIKSSLFKVSKMIEKTLRIVVFDSFLKTQPETLSSWSVTLDATVIERFIDRTYDRITNVHSIVPINVREISELFKEFLIQDLKTFNDQFIYKIGELSHLMHNPANFLRAEYESIFIKAIMENEWSSEGRLDWIVRIMQNLNQENTEFDQLFAFLYNFRKSSKAIDIETDRFAIRCIQQIFRHHYQSTNSLTGLSHMRLFSVTHTIVNNDPLFIEFIRLYPFNNDQDGLLLKWMNLMLVNEQTTLNPSEYSFLIQNLDQIRMATPDMYYLLGFANHLLINNLIKLNKEQTFYLDFYGILSAFITSPIAKVKKNLGSAFNSFLDSHILKTDNQAISSVTYFVAKILNALSNEFQETGFDLSFVQRQSHDEDKQDINYFITKFEEFEMLLRKIYQNLRSEEDGSKASVDTILETFYQIPLASNNFEFGKFESLDQDFIPSNSSLIDYTYAISFQYSSKKIKINGLSESEVDVFTNNNEDLHIEVKSLAQVRAAGEVELRLENAILQLETPVETDNILKDVLSNMYEVDD